jgi:DNA replication protein DnaC
LKGYRRQPAKLKGAQLEEELEDIFKDFKPLGDPELEKALAEAKQFCREMASHDKPGRWITFLGPSGTGKTMLVRRINRFFKRNLDLLTDERCGVNERYCRRGGFKPWVDAIGDMLSGDYSGLRLLEEDWFVALDDIGAEYSRNRELAVSKLYQVLNSREGLFTALTANLTLEEINDKMDARIASRLLRNQSAVVNVATEDFNLRS